MIHIISHTIFDSLKLLPFLFVTFLIIEYIEHKLGEKQQNKLKSSKFGPFVGSLFGAFPQCGFSVVATNLYVTRIISLGTLIAIYLSTSDEMLPILVANQVEFSIIVKIIGIKVLIGMICGFIIDFIYRKKEAKEKEHFDICEDSHCGCEKSILKSSLKHTFSIMLFIIVVTFILNIFMEYFGEEFLRKLFFNNNVLAPFVSSLIGLIPNCASSVLLTQLYLDNIITLGTSIAGLLVGSGVGLLILFKQNKNMKENIFILIILYLIGVVSGIVINFLNIL